MKRKYLFGLVLEMSDEGVERQVVSEDEVAGGEKLVPVSEAIRYRKRAQGAEQEIGELSRRLTAAEESNLHLKEELESVRTDQLLVTRLTGEGAVDVEAAILLAKERLGRQGEDDIDGVIEQLKSEKGYLFEASEEGVFSKTSGVKEKKPNGRRSLESTAKRAAASGSRADVQDYLRARRQFV